MEYIFVKLCDVDMDISFVSFGFKVVLEFFDIDSLLFVLIIEEMIKCIDIIFSIVFRMI